MAIKTTFTAAIVALAVVGLSSCGGNSQAEAEKARQDSIARVDSLAKVEAAARQDSIMMSQLHERYENGLTVKVGKIDCTPVADTEMVILSTTVTVTNNTGVALASEEYTISYIVEYANCSDGSVPNTREGVTLMGPALAPGESTSIKLSKQCDDMSRFKAKMKIPEDEFVARHKSAPAAK